MIAPHPALAGRAECPKCGHWHLIGAIPPECIEVPGAASVAAAQVEHREAKSDSAARDGERKTADAGSSAAPSKPRRGQQHEDALYAALTAAGFIDLGLPGVGIETFCYSGCFLRQYPWGAYLPEPRRFCADAAFPFGLNRMLVEIEGGAHGVQRMRKHDVLRRQLAESAGWRVLSVLPEQVKSGEALDLIRAALNNARGDGRE